ncbi:NAD(P)H-binding protein [Streptomyces sp. VRA16 Mangrove soil]|uniref:NAD(P)H-binding protein n=1 Tax=Streptomyces sp. VRA16 Mangrove soil TaxID=2817434 RepID=UPI001A9E7054|nr:NAD(P)H-binding protein [Streptomyces sp. VRA16 Mangrove soil]MBO1331309.1 NAD(P)H-binding protein [Streptomyces sp. VRA16 Mangrove soil]
MILISGATGTIGSEVVRLLAGRGVPHRALTRDPARARSGPHTEVVRGDYGDPESLAAALTGADAVFMVNTPGAAGPGVHDRALYDAAVTAGVRRAVKLSAIGTGDPASGTFSQWHVPGEQALRDGPLEWTILRPTMFASNFLWWAGEVRAGRPVPDQYDGGAQGVVDPADIAAVAVEALLGEGHQGRTYTPTGPEALSVPQMAVALGRVLGRDIEAAALNEADKRAMLVSFGIPEQGLDGILEGLAYVRDGHNAVVTDDVERVVGRPPRTFEEWARDHKEAFV